MVLVPFGFVRTTWYLVVSFPLIAGGHLSVSASARAAATDVFSTTRPDRVGHRLRRLGEAGDLSSLDVALFEPTMPETKKLRSTRMLRSLAISKASVCYARRISCRPNARPSTRFCSCVRQTGRRWLSAMISSGAIPPGSPRQSRAIRSREDVGEMGGRDTAFVAIGHGVGDAA